MRQPRPSIARHLRWRAGVVGILGTRTLPNAVTSEGTVSRTFAIDTHTGSQASPATALITPNTPQTLIMVVDHRFHPRHKRRENTTSSLPARCGGAAFGKPPRPCRELLFHRDRQLCVSIRITVSADVHGARQHDAEHPQTVNLCRDDGSHRDGERQQSHRERGAAHLRRT